jgi:hypothetical protein
VGLTVRDPGRGDLLDVDTSDARVRAAYAGAEAERRSAALRKRSAALRKS